MKDEKSIRIKENVIWYAREVGMPLSEQGVEEVTQALTELIKKTYEKEKREMFLAVEAEYAREFLHGKLCVKVESQKQLDALYYMLPTLRNAKHRPRFLKSLPYITYCPDREDIRMQNVPLRIPQVLKHRAFDNIVIPYPEYILERLNDLARESSVCIPNISEDDVNMVLQKVSDGRYKLADALADAISAIEERAKEYPSDEAWMDEENSLSER